MQALFLMTPLVCLCCYTWLCILSLVKQKKHLLRARLVYLQPFIIVLLITVLRLHVLCELRSESARYNRESLLV
uniref:Secreted protein n=1 Tax=Haemonchus contortus TaxID=6289 RepID=A0A6F7PKJ3_HAECO